MLLIVLALCSACSSWALKRPRPAASAPAFRRPHNSPNPSLDQARVKSLAKTAGLTTQKMNMYFIETQITSTFSIEPALLPSLLEISSSSWNAQERGRLFGDGQVYVQIKQTDQTTSISFPT
jgi:hypothetical protein